MIDAITAIAAIVNSVVGLLNLAILLAGVLSIKNGINIIHKQTNSMKDQLVNEVRIAALAKGALDQKARDRDG